MEVNQLIYHQPPALYIDEGLYKYVCSPFYGDSSEHKPSYYVICKHCKTKVLAFIIFYAALKASSYDKVLDQTKLKAFTGDKLNVTKLIISVFDRVENIVGKGEITCTCNFSFSENVFKQLLSQTHQKVLLYGNGLRLGHTKLTDE